MGLCSISGGSAFSTERPIASTPVKKVLLISNPRGGSVSPRVREVIVKALAADFKLEVVDTAARDHATELSRDAVDRDFDTVLAFGGDGTINEAAQGLVGTDVALGALPGGSTNVMVRSLGVPQNPVEATAFVASRIRSRTTRRINVGQIDDRYFLFSAGMGLDGEIVKRVEAEPKMRPSDREWVFFSEALKAAITEYRGIDPWITVDVEGTAQRRVVTALCCNARPFTYFKRFPIDACPRARLDAGVDVVGFTRVRAITIPRIAWAFFVSRSHIDWRNTLYLHDVASASLSADRLLPVQVDGDYIGDRRNGRVRVVRDSLELVI